MKKILIVEDDADVREVLIKTMEKVGYETSGANNGAVAWDMLQKEKPDLVVLDVNMPIMNGIELLRRIRQDKNLEDISVVMLTARAKDYNITQGYSFGADYYITKPFTPMTVVGAIKTLLGE